MVTVTAAWTEVFPLFNYEVEDVPENVFLKEDFGAYRAQFREMGSNRIVYSRELISKSTEFPANSPD